MADSRPFRSAPILPESLRREDETLEPLLLGSGFILQKRQGYRFSLDAVILADFVARSQGKAKRETRYLDLCTGCGIVLVLLAKWGRGLRGCGVEIQEPLAEMAKRNLALHSLEDRFQILCMNLKDLPTSFSPGAFNRPESTRR